MIIDDLKIEYENVLNKVKTIKECLWQARHWTKIKRIKWNFKLAKVLGWCSFCKKNKQRNKTQQYVNCKVK